MSGSKLDGFEYGHIFEYILNAPGLYTYIEFRNQLQYWVNKYQTKRFYVPNPGLDSTFSVAMNSIVLRKHFEFKLKFNKMYVVPICV